MKPDTILCAALALTLVAGCGEKAAETPKPEVEAPPPVVQPEPPSPPTEPLRIGSQDAQDDLYCSGLIYAVHKANAYDSLSDAADKRRAAVLALAIAGVARLKAEGVATEATTAAIADAHTDKASADLDAGTLRIPYETCLARAAALPPTPK